MQAALSERPLFNHSTCFPPSSCHHLHFLWKEILSWYARGPPSSCLLGFRSLLAHLLIRIS